MSLTEALRTARLTLIPLEPKDAVEMVGVLSDPTLYTFTGGVAPTFDELGELYRLPGCPRHDEIWHNWIIRLDCGAIGLVQATVKDDGAELV
jgi:hypothetical protein